MATRRTHELGKGFTIREYYDPLCNELVGYTVTGPAAPECKHKRSKLCGGLCAIKPYSVPIDDYGKRKEYSVWTVTGEWPLISLSPSVACDCGGQHSFVQEGVWL